jgi:hypothetical protein
MTTLREVLIDIFQIEEGCIQNLELIETIKKEVLPKYHPYINYLISYLASDVQPDDEDNEEKEYGSYKLLLNPNGWVATTPSQFQNCHARTFRWKNLPFIVVIHNMENSFPKYPPEQLILYFFKYIFNLGLDPEFTSYYKLSTDLNWKEIGFSIVTDDRCCDCVYCRQRIYGMGYHCTICYNIDICSKCYNIFILDIIGTSEFHLEYILGKFDYHRHHHHLQQVNYGEERIINTSSDSLFD